MALANTAPVYSKIGKIAANISALITAVATNLYDAAGTIGTDIYLLFTADATNGSFVQRIRVKYVSNSTTASVACVLKIFISTQTSGATTNANTWLYDEIVLPTTGALTTTVAQVSYDIPLGFALPAGYALLAKITVAQTNANSGWVCTVIGGDY